MRSVDLFAGIGGWSVACAQLGIEDHGIELDSQAAATMRAAGFDVTEADVTKLDPLEFGPVDLLIASPPCQTFSSAGKGAGRHVIDALQQSIKDAFAGSLDRDLLINDISEAISHKYADPDKARAAATNSVLVVEPVRWIMALRPRAVAFEQVMAVLPLWESYAEQLESIGYSVWTGIVNAADYGVPQTRKRAVLIASLDREVSCPPPTHAKDPAPDSGLLPWVTMAEALGWGFDKKPSHTLVGGSLSRGGSNPLDGGSGARAAIRTAQEEGDWVGVGFPRKDDTGTSSDGYRERDLRSIDEPAFTVTEKARSWEAKVITGNNGTYAPPEVKDHPYGCPECGCYWEDHDEGGFCAGPCGGNRCHGRQFLEEETPDPLAQGVWGGKQWPWNRPATTLQAESRIGAPIHHDNATHPGVPRSAGAVPSSDVRAGDYDGARAVKLAIEEALVLQAFPPDHPVTGTRTAQFRQVGNAIPPGLSHHLLAVLV